MNETIKWGNHLHFPNVSTQIEYHIVLLLPLALTNVKQEKEDPFYDLAHVNVYVHYVCICTTACRESVCQFIYLHKLNFSGETKKRVMSVFGQN